MLVAAHLSSWVFFVLEAKQALPFTDGHWGIIVFWDLDAAGIVGCGVLFFSFFFGPALFGKHSASAASAKVALV